ncbi:hypothetical protein U1Q18_051104 [Sarracenia purpurea var. burkii]
MSGVCIKFRTIILHRGLADRSAVVTKECLKLLKDDWLVKCCNGDPIELLKYLDVETYESVGESGAATSDNVEEWKWKLTSLLRSKNELELVSKDKKKTEIEVLASKMGSYSHLYAKVVVVSKVPLSNYRFDLDESPPQRELILPLGDHLS